MNRSTSATRPMNPCDTGASVTPAKVSDAATPPRTVVPIGSCRMCAASLRRASFSRHPSEERTMRARLPRIARVGAAIASSPRRLPPRPRHSRLAAGSSRGAGVPEHADVHLRFHGRQTDLHGAAGRHAGLLPDEWRAVGRGGTARLDLRRRSRPRRRGHRARRPEHQPPRQSGCVTDCERVPADRHVGWVDDGVDGMASPTRRERSRLTYVWTQRRSDGRPSRTRTRRKTKRHCLPKTST